MIDVKDRTQWYVLTAIGGQESSIAEALREKANNYKYANFEHTNSDEKSKEFLDNGSRAKVVQIKVFTKKTVDTKVFSKNDPELPKNLKNTKTTEWASLPDGRYQRSKTKIVNRFPGYIFVCCDLDDEIWYAIRNTVGVLGFVGSTGKNTKPIPCATYEFEKLLTDAATIEYASTIQVKSEQEQQAKKAAKAEPKAKPVVTECPYKVGQNVVVNEGSFEGTVAKVSAINLEKQTITVDVEFFGRVTSFDIGFDKVKLEK